MENNNKCSPHSFQVRRTSTQNNGVHTKVVHFEAVRTVINLTEFLIRSLLPPQVQHRTIFAVPAKRKNQRNAADKSAARSTRFIVAPSQPTVVALSLPDLSRKVVRKVKQNNAEKLFIIYLEINQRVRFHRFINQLLQFASPHKTCEFIQSQMDGIGHEWPLTSDALNDCRRGFDSDGNVCSPLQENLR